MRRMRGDLRCVLIAGDESGFCAGNDLGDSKWREAGGFGQPIVRFLHVLARNRNRAVAAVAGNAVGIGTTMLWIAIMLSLARTRRYRRRSSRRADARGGIEFDRAPIDGQARAFELLVMGYPLLAHAAKAAGIVEYGRPGRRNWNYRFVRRARHWKKLPPQGVLAGRALLRGSVTDRCADRSEVEVFRQRLTSPEAKAALQAFFSGRSD